MITQTTVDPPPEERALVERHGGAMTQARHGTNLRVWLRLGRMSGVLVRPDGIIQRSGALSDLYAAPGVQPCCRSISEESGHRALGRVLLPVSAAPLRRPTSSSGRSAQPPVARSK
jgi:hypothetical protein